jgi:N-acetylglucosamine-6-sulfatase
VIVSTKRKALKPAGWLSPWLGSRFVDAGLLLSLGILLLLAGLIGLEGQQVVVSSFRPTSIFVSKSGGSADASLSGQAPDRSGAASAHLQLNRPNIILILADDLDMRPINFMPNLQALLVKQGLTFSNTFVTQSFCCPSRASILRGQYPHNHKIQANDPPDGGFQKFKNLGYEKSTIATWLQGAGYQTVLIGKYLNGYDKTKAAYVPPGWTEWYAALQEGAYFNYALSENGQIVSYGSAPQDYMTDVQTNKAVDFIQRTAPTQQPFFIYLAPFAPHLQGRDVDTGTFMPPIPAPRHQGTFQNEQAPRPPSFNELDVSDKPPWIRKLPRLSASQIDQIDTLYRARLESMLAVDDMIATLVQTLENTGELDHTFILFSSDNGFHLGQHRLLWGKSRAYEEDIHVPLIVRGPNIPAEQAREHFALNIDLAPTLAELAGVSIPKFVDGRSLVPLLGNSPLTLADWRQGFLVERWPTSAVRAGTKTVYHALRTHRYLYVEYLKEHELYDLKLDPYELDNFYFRADPQLVNPLASQLAALRTCAKASCRTAESQLQTSQLFMSKLYLPLIIKTDND